VWFDSRRARIKAIPWCIQQGIIDVSHDDADVGVIKTAYGRSGERLYVELSDRD